jgi:hypothetical protein
MYILGDETYFIFSTNQVFPPVVMPKEEQTDCGKQDHCQYTFDFVVHDVNILSDARFGCLSARVLLIVQRYFQRRPMSLMSGRKTIDLHQVADAD